MDRNGFQDWMEALGRHWETKDSRGFSELFAEGIDYHFTPFEEPKRGRSEVEEAVERAHATQGGIKFGHEILSFQDDTGICRWWCDFTRTTTGKPIRLDGILICEFDPNDFCRTFREWCLKDGE